MKLQRLRSNQRFYVCNPNQDAATEGLLPAEYVNCRLQFSVLSIHKFLTKHWLLKTLFTVIVLVAYFIPQIEQYNDPTVSSVSRDAVNL